MAIIRRSNHTSLHYFWVSRCEIGLKHLLGMFWFVLNKKQIYIFQLGNLLSDNGMEKAKSHVKKRPAPTEETWDQTHASL